jgi:hypothetical protein
MSAEIDAEEIERWIQVATETLNKGKDIKTRTFNFVDFLQ